MCRRSASLIRITRISFAMARNIFLKFSACTSTLSASYDNCSNFVTPSTSSATSAPNSCAISSSVITVSSTISCKRPATMVSLSSSSSARIMDTQSGWIMYASPDFLFWSLCADAAIRYAFSTCEISVDGWYFLMLFISSLYNSSGSIKSGILRIPFLFAPIFASNSSTVSCGSFIAIERSAIPVTCFLALLILFTLSLFNN